MEGPFPYPWISLPNASPWVLLWNTRKKPQDEMAFIHWKSICVPVGSCPWPRLVLPQSLYKCNFRCPVDHHLNTRELPIIPSFSQGKVNWHFPSLMRIVMRHYYVPRGGEGLWEWWELCENISEKLLAISHPAFTSDNSPWVSGCCPEGSIGNKNIPDTPNCLCRKKTNSRSQT